MVGSKDFNESLNRADETVHPVETQWHFEPMTKAGYVSLTDSEAGLVRSYVYEHKTTNHRIRLTTGLSADYWTDLETKEFGYWGSLTAHLASK